jgi:hypothetical protein
MPLPASDDVEQVHNELNADGSLADITKPAVPHSINRDNHSNSSKHLHLSQEEEEEEERIQRQAEKPVGFEGSMDAWIGPVLVAPRNMDRGFPPFIATIIKSVLSIFSDDGDVDLKDRELLSTYDDDDDDDEEEEEEDDNDDDEEKGRAYKRGQHHGYAQVNYSHEEDE